MKKRTNKIVHKVKYKFSKANSAPYIVRESGPNYDTYQLQVNEQKKAKIPFSTLSLFSGCGGLDLGFVGGFGFLNKQYSRNNFKVIWANDIDEASCQTFARYFKHNVVCGDITQILNGKYAARLFEAPLPPKVDIVLGGFPCQDFSHAGKRKGFNSKRGLLYQSMAEVIKRTRPVLFVAENVRGLLTMNGGEAIQTI